MHNREREQEILNILKAANGFVSTKQFSDTLFASESSIRRDLKSLEEHGLVKRSYGGATLENVAFDNIHYNGTAGHCDKEWMNEPGTPYSGCALDFRRMREEDFFKNVVFRDIFAREGAELCIACDKIKPDIRN